MPRDAIVGVQRAFVQAWYGYPLFGTPEQIVDEILELNQAVFDGIALSWVDFERGVTDVNETITPLTQHAGLRTGAPLAQLPTS